MKIDIRLIKPNPVALRQVDKKNPKFAEIVQSVPKVGILNPINVRKKTVDGLEFYELVDGLHRYSAALECGLSEIPCHVLGDEFQDDSKVLAAQMIGNLCKVDTKPVEYTKQLIRIMQINKTVTEDELASMCGVTKTFIQQRLKLDKIKDAGIQALINDGKIILQNAYALASLPESEQLALRDQAITEPPASFLPAVKARQKQLNEGRNTGAGPVDVFPGAHAHCRPMKEIEASLSNPTITSMTATDVLNWVLHLDPESVAKARADWEARKAKRDEALAKRSEEAKKRLAGKADELKKKSEEAAKALSAMMGN